MAGLHAVGADDRPEHADAAHEQREDDALVAEARHAEDHRGDNRHLVALEDVGRHAGAVAHVVAHVVGDRRGVARVVFGDVLLDLADQVRAHVGGLRVDAAAHAHEEREQRAAEPEAEQRLVRLDAVDEEDHRAAEQPQAVGQHAGDRARAVAELHRLAVAAHRRRGHAQVARGGQAHADEAHRPAEQRADQERPRAAPAERRLGAHVGHGQQHRDERDERGDAPELRRQVRVGALADGGGHLLHLRRAGSRAVHLAVEAVRVEEARDRHAQHQQQRHLLDRGEARVRERREEVEDLLAARGLLHRRLEGGGGRLPEHRRGKAHQQDDGPPGTKAGATGYTNAAHGRTTFRGTTGAVTGPVSPPACGARSRHEHGRRNRFSTVLLR